VQGPVLEKFVLGSDPYAAGQHRGIDIGAVSGDPVLAATAGTVSFVGTVPVSGKVVTIQTADGYSVTLTHLGSASVRRGETVAEGAVVGTIGPTGEIEHDTPYVHLGLRHSEDPNGYVDPLLFLPAPAAPPTAPSPTPPAAPAPSPAPPPVSAPPAARVPAPAVSVPVAGAPAAKPAAPIAVARTAATQRPHAAPIGDRRVGSVLHARAAATAAAVPSTPHRAATADRLSAFARGSFVTIPERRLQPAGIEERPVPLSNSDLTDPRRVPGPNAPSEEARAGERLSNAPVWLGLPPY
jgi:hypothetical protein